MSLSAFSSSFIVWSHFLLIGVVNACDLIWGRRVAGSSGFGRFRTTSKCRAHRVFCFSSKISPDFSLMGRMCSLFWPQGSHVISYFSVHLSIRYLVLVQRSSYLCRNTFNSLSLLFHPWWVFAHRYFSSTSFLSSIFLQVSDVNHFSFFHLKQITFLPFECRRSWCYSRKDSSLLLLCVGR